MRYLIFVIVCLSFAIFLYSDNDVALIYIKKAQELAKKKEYKEALKNFRKAIDEAPELVDTYFALGEMYRDIGESIEARTNFNKALSLIEGQGASDKLKPFQSKINSYLTEYDKLRQELNKINEQFLKSLLPLLEKYEKEDPELALIISEKTLKIEPDNKMFLNKRKELRQKLADTKKEQMTSLFNGNDFDGWEVSPEYWSVKNNLIGFDCNTPSIVSAIYYKSKIGGDYNVVTKIKLENTYPKTNKLFLSFGFQSISVYYAFGFFDQKLSLVKHMRDNDDVQKLKEKDISSDINIFDWNELEVEVYGKIIRCYLNGELYFEYEESNKDTLRGNVALIGNNCSGYFKDILYSSDD